jgi:hypothetical protein
LFGLWFVTRRVERRGPADEHDKHGKLAEDALIEALLTRHAPTDADQISLDTKITSLIERHLARLAEDGRSPSRYPHIDSLPRS